MQISSRIVLACVITTMVSPTFLRAADTEAQIKARQALEQKMQELQTSSGMQTPAEQPVAPMTKPAAPVAKPTQPAPTAPTIVAKPKQSNAPVFQTAPQASSADIEKAREALRKTMQEMQNRPEPEATAEAPKPKEPAQASKTKKKEPVFENTPAVATAAPAPVKKSEPKKVEEKKAKQPEKTVAAAKSPMTLQPLQGPPTGLSADQEQQLQDLLQQYRQDKLSPDEYHTARLKVLGRQ